LHRDSSYNVLLYTRYLHCNKSTEALLILRLENFD
jgi:hypothetical protein